MVGLKTVSMSHMAGREGCGTLKLIANQEHEDEPARKHSHVPTFAALSGRVSAGP
jgi:hypothetical protein